MNTEQVTLRVEHGVNKCGCARGRQPRDPNFQVADDVDTASFALQESKRCTGVAAVRPPSVACHLYCLPGFQVGAQVVDGKKTPPAASCNGGAPLLSPVQCAVREELDSVGETPSGSSKATSVHDIPNRLFTDFALHR